MSVVSLTTGEATCTADELREICAANNISFESESANETAFITLLSSFDAVCKQIEELEVYEEPRLQPVSVEGGERSFRRPSDAENPLNAWSHLTALKSADANAAKGPLAGKTFAIKDNVSVAGLPHVIGSSPKLWQGGKHPISTIDATIVQRILNAGGTIKGTSTCENLSLAPLSFTADAGNVHNAWLPGYATGGSSSGSASLVSIADVVQARGSGKNRSEHALGEGVDMAIGGDQGGSIRLPASYAGIYGLKPTHGLVPYTGIASLHPMLDHTGPMARSIDDIALLLGVLAGYDGIDPRMTPETPTLSQVPNYLDELQHWISSRTRAGEWNTTSAAKGLRVGILKEAFEVPGIDQAVASTLRAAADRFRALGAEVTEVSAPLHRAGAALWTVAPRAAIPRSLANQPGELLAHPLPHLSPRPFDDVAAATLLRRNPAVVNTLLTATRLARKPGGAQLSRKAQMHVFQLRAEYDRALEAVDVLLAPVTPTAAPRFPVSSLRSAENPGGWSERVMDLFEPGVGVTQNTCPFNLSGHPAMAMPAGWVEVEGGAQRLPVGMQLVAKRWDEASIFRAAKAWEVGGRGLDG